MTIIVFLIDTSASMYQRAYLGGRPTLLDMAKGAVETFVKVRQRIPESRGDRYMLLTFEDPPHNIKAGWKENLVTFMNELKNLQCQGMTTMGPALKHAFDVLNINRMQTGIDTYGQGRSPFYLEPSVIVVITDGGRLSNLSGVQDEFNLPMHSPIPGCELTREPFRWDQRLFALVLRLAGTPAVERDVGLVPSDSSPIDAMCEVTGGRSYSVTSQRMLHQCIDSLVQKVQSGVVINFEKVGPDPPPVNTDGTKESTEGVDQESEKDFDKDLVMLNDVNKVQNGARHVNNVNSSSATGPASWQSCRKLIYVPRSAQKGFPVGFWPIPESFWPDLQSQTLPPRSAHPNVKFTCTSQDPMVIENLPFDKYELEPSPLTQFILARKQPTVCWQVFVSNSYKNSEMGHPFGYLKASTNLSCVNLFVMPYNYPVLLPLLDELFKVHRQKQTPEWRAAFANYLKTMPSYYAAPLRRALQRMGATGSLAQNLVPDSLDNCMSYSVLNYLKRLKNQAKIEYEKLCNDVSSKQMTAKAASQATEGVRVIPRCPLKRDLLSHPMLQDKFQSFRDQLNEFGGFVVGVSHRKHRSGQSFRNAFDIQRRNLVGHILRMRANLLTPALSHIKLLDDDVVHSMPISQMGNYQEHLKKTQPSLREVESAPVRQHMFGNPFKIDKRMMVDEADIDLVGGGSGSSSVSGSGRGQKRTLEGGNPSRPNKRKPGPIPANVTVRRPLSPFAVVSPPTSPRPSPPASPLPIPPSSVVVSPSPTPPPIPSLTLLSGTSSSLQSPPPSPSPPPLVPVIAPQPPPTASSSALATFFKPVPRMPTPLPNVQVPSSVPQLPSTSLNSIPTVRAPSPPQPRTAPSPPPLINGDLGDMVIDESERSRSPSPTTLDSAEFAPPPVLQPYDGGGAPETPGGACPPSYSVTPPLSPPSLTAVPPETEANDGQDASVASSRKELADIRKHNLNVRALAYKEVRRPGRNYDVLFEHLDTMKGPAETKIALLKEVINESLRFKRRALASHLDKQLKALAASPLPNHKGHNGSR